MGCLNSSTLRPSDGFLLENRRRRSRSVAFSPILSDPTAGSNDAPNERHRRCPETGLANSFRKLSSEESTPSMKTNLRSIFTILVLVSLSASAGIDTRLLGSSSTLPLGYAGDSPGNSVDDDQDGSIDEPDFIVRNHIVGQTFQVLPGQPIITQLRLQTKDTLFGDSRDMPVEFKIRIMNWDGGSHHPVGGVLFESGLLTTVQNGDITEHQVPVPNLLLSLESQYVVLIQQEDPEPTNGNNSLCQVVARSGDPLDTGIAVFKTNGLLGLAGIESEPFVSSSGIDLALQIETAAVPVVFDTRNVASDVGLPFGTVGEIADNSIDDNQNGTVDEVDPALTYHHTVGQTFQVPAMRAGLNRIVFTLKDEQFNGASPINDQAVEFSLTVMAWDEAELHPAGQPLHISDSRLSIQDGQIREVVFDALDLELAPGKTHVAYLSQTNFGLEQGNNTLCSVLARSDNPYPYGSIFTRSDPSNLSVDLTAGAWTQVAADALVEFDFTPLDTAADSNDDGLPDYLVAAYGLDPGVDYSALASPLRQLGREQVTSDPSAFDLYTPASIHDLDFGGLIIQKSNSLVDVSFDLLTSPNLSDWTSVEQIQRQITLPEDKMFLRVRSQPVQPSTSP